MTFKATSICISLLLCIYSSVDAGHDIQERELTYYPAEKKQSVRLYGNIHAYAYWFVDLLVGTPPQRTSVIIDTGSSVCAFTCNVCKQCGSHIDLAFNFDASTTATWSSCSTDCPSGTCLENHCSYSIAYSEGSAVSGFWFHDVVQLGDLMEANLPLKSFLGCHTSETKLFFTQSVNGILGLAPGRTEKYPMILSSLFADERIDKRVFSLCLSKEGGELTVGGHNGDESALSYVPLKVEVFYTVPLSSISVGSSVLGTMLGSTIVDSGTTLSYFPPEIFHNLVTTIESILAHNESVKKEGSRCWSVQDAPSSLFPTVTFKFGSVSIDWEPEAYLYSSRSGSNCYAFGMSDSSMETILGASFMINKNMVFDLVQGKLGIGRSSCPSYSERPPHSIVETTSTSTTTQTVVTSTTQTPSATELVIQAAVAMKNTIVESTSIPVIEPEPSSLWYIWLLIGLVTMSVVALLYRRWARGTVVESEREQLRVSDMESGEEIS